MKKGPFNQFIRWTPMHEERSIQSNYQEVATKRCLCQFDGEIFRYERWFVKQCVRDFRFLRKFSRIFEMFVNEHVCERTDYEFSAAICIELSTFWCEVFAIIMGCLRIETPDRMVKDWWDMVFTPEINWLTCRRENCLRIYNNLNISPTFSWFYFNPSSN